MCGEQSLTSVAVRPVNGSSPRVRGTGSRRWNELRRRRIIPACAGNRCTASSSTARSTDHPRVCGEQDIRLPQCNLGVGSSPRVRGTASRVPLRQPRPRIIPACAGNSTYNAIRPLTGPDHPRVCGEQSASLQLSTCCGGSSPRVRGTGLKKDIPTTVKRIIPACAGNRHDHQSRSR